MKVLFVSGFGPIVSDMQESAAFYRESLGLSFQEEADGYLHTEELQGIKTFAFYRLLWLLLLPERLVKGAST